MERVVELSNAGKFEVGPKAQSLARLTELRLSAGTIPRGFALTADAYRNHIADNDLAESIAEATSAASTAALSELLATLRDRIATAPLAAPLESEIGRQLGQLPDGGVAVRSSGTAEDLAQFSFAGLHDSYLNVVGLSDCLEAIRNCWASMWTERAFHYRAQAGIDHADAAMGVVVQDLVPAEVSGVAFSADPRTGDRGRIIIESTYGLGSVLVSGQVSPDRHVIDKKSLEVLETTTGGKAIEEVTRPGGNVEERNVEAERCQALALSPNQATTLATVVRELENEIGTPQDVEWAFAGRELYLLQARPLTTIDDPDVGQVWSNLNAGEVLPDVVSPLSWSLIEGVQRLIRQLFQRVGIDTGDHPIAGRVAGRVYFNLNVFAGIIRTIPFVSTVDMSKALGGMTDSGEDPFPDIPKDKIPRVRAGVFRILFHLPGLLLWAWRHRPCKADGYLAELVARRDELSRVSPKERTDAELVEICHTTVSELFEDHSVLGFPMVGMTYFDALDRVCSKWFRGDDPVSANQLLVGHGQAASAVAGLDLWRLAVEVDRDPEVRAVVAGEGCFDEVRARVAGISGGKRFLDAWDGFVELHGHHARGEIELMTPRWAESPDYLLGLLRSYLEMMPEKDLLKEVDERSREREAAAARCEARLGPIRRPIFRHLYRNSVLGSAARENIKSESVKHLLVMRRNFQELERRWIDRGILSQPNDIFFLSLEELTAAVRAESPNASELRARVARQRAEHERNLRVTPPPIVVGRYRGEVSADQELDSNLLTGVAVSAGVVTGRARVILYADSDERVESGEILVAPFTDPGWTPYFLPAAGIVMDLGGMLSHGSIVAREYGIPAVVNVGPATKWIETGQLLEVDGDRGEVRILDEAPAG